MHPLTPLRTMTPTALLALASVFAAAPQAGAAISETTLNPPRVLDNGKILSVPISAASGEIADTAIVRNVADALIGGWAGRLIEYAARDAPPAAPTCRVAATVTDPDGATGTASAVIPADVSIYSLPVPDQAPGTQWGVGDVDHFTLKLTCTDVHRNTQLSEVTIDQDAIAA